MGWTCQAPRTTVPTGGGRRRPARAGHRRRGRNTVSFRSAGEKEGNLANWIGRDPEVKCYLPGVPRATYLPFPFQIVQGTQNIMIVYEYAATNRTIHMTKL